MSSRERLSATVDPALLAAGRAAVAAGRTPSLSAWVNDALQRQVEHDQRMHALDAFLASYEQQHGEISDQEIQAATREFRAAATVVRGSGPATADMPAARRASP